MANGSQVHLVRARYLDPRPADEAERSPIVDAANVPLEELAERTHELPAPGPPILVAAEGDLAERTVARLRGLGRDAEIVSFHRSKIGNQKSNILWRPHPMVAEHVERAPPGLALDLGCGTGRDAVYLAAAGWRVIAIDRLEDALERGRGTAERTLGALAERIDWRLGEIADIVLAERFDLILIIFAFDRVAFARAKERLAPGGVLLVETFTPLHRAERGWPRSSGSTLDAEEVRRLLPDLKLDLDEAWRNDRHTLRLRATR